MPSRRVCSLDQFSPDTQTRIARMQRERLDDLRGRQRLPRLQRTMSSLYVARSGNNELSQLAEIADKKGVCHHLANEDKLTWRPS